MPLLPDKNDPIVILFVLCMLVFSCMDAMNYVVYFYINNHQML